MASTFQLFLTLVTTIIETILYSGVVYGWASIHEVFVHEQYFKADNETAIGNLTSNDSDQIKNLNLVFTISSSLTPITLFLIGLLLDRKGIWVARTILLVVQAVGYTLIALVPPNYSYVLFFTIPCLDIGGLGMLTVNSQIGNLFQNHRSTVLTTLCGCFTTSAAVFLTYNYLYFNLAISVKSLFLSGALLSLPLHMKTFFLMPKNVVPKSLPKDYNYGYKELSIFQKHRFRSINPAKSTVQDKINENSNVQSDDKKSFKECLFTKITFVYVSHFCLLQFGCIYFLGTFNTWVKNRLPEASSEEITFQVRMFNIFRCMAVIIGLVCGAVINKVYSFFCKGKTELYIARKKAGAWSLILTSIVTSCMFAASLINVSYFRYVTYFLNAVTNSMLYGSMSSNIACCYPAKHFGKMYGLTYAVGGLSLLLQYPLTVATVNLPREQQKYVNFFFLASSLLTVLLPCSILSNLSKNKENDSKNKTIVSLKLL